MLDLKEVVTVQLTRENAAICVIALSMLEGYKLGLDPLIDEAHKKLEVFTPVGVVSRVMGMA